MTDLAPVVAPAHTEPALALFPSLEAAELALKTQAEAAGFLASRRRSKRSRLGDFRKVWFQCVHGRPHQKKGAATATTPTADEDAAAALAPLAVSASVSASAGGKKARKTTSARIGCPWQATAHRLDGVKGNEWQLTIVEATHNHAMESDLSIYAAARKPSRDEERLVESLLAAGAAPREVIASVKQAFPQSRLINRDIYNMRKKLRGNFSDLLQALQTKYDGLLPRQKFAVHERVKKLCEDLEIDLERQAAASPMANAAAAPINVPINAPAAASASPMALSDAAVAGMLGGSNATVNAAAAAAAAALEAASVVALAPRVEPSSNVAEILSTITRQCGICGGLGHFLAHCPKRQRMREASASTATSVVTAPAQQAANAVPVAINVTSAAAAAATAAATTATAVL